MKRFLYLLLAFSLFLAFTGCKKEEPKTEISVEITNKDKEYVDKAIELLKAEWDKNVYANHDDAFKNVEILNTKIIYINSYKSKSPWEDAECVVEFELRSNFYGTGAEYRSNYHAYNDVVFNKNGTTTIWGNLFRKYISAYYSLARLGEDVDLTVKDFGASFNRAFLGTLAPISTPDKTDSEYIEKAIALIEQEWESVYINIKSSHNLPKNHKYTEYLKIIDTNIVYIDACKNSTAKKHFENVECIVEFELLSNLHLSGPDYFSNLAFLDNVIFYKDGSSEITTGHMHRYMTTPNEYDTTLSYVDITAKYFGTRYNRVLINNPAN